MKLEQLSNEREQQIIAKHIAEWQVAQKSGEINYKVGKAISNEQMQESATETIKNAIRAIEELSAMYDALEINE